MIAAFCLDSNIARLPRERLLVNHSYRNVLNYEEIIEVTECVKCNISFDHATMWIMHQSEKHRYETTFEHKQRPKRELFFVLSQETRGIRPRKVCPQSE